MANSFIAAVTCPKCDKLIVDNGKTLDFTCDEGVVNLELFSQREFECEDCGTKVYTGDVSDFIMAIDKDGEEL